MSEVRVTQVVAEVIVPFVEGNTTAAGVTTERFDAGEGSEWYICSSVVDSGVELLAKTIKGMRAIGKLTNASMMLFGYDIGDGIDVGDLETGTNSSTGSVALTDSTQVAQSRQGQIVQLVPWRLPTRLRWPSQQCSIRT
jgi:hypothetical protein